MTSPIDPTVSLQLEIAALRARLTEARQTLDAIRNGQVDAVVIGGPAGQQVFTLSNADRPYRVLVEQMQEGAVTTAADGTVLYCNERFADIVERPRETLIGHDIVTLFSSEEGPLFRELLNRDRQRRASGEFCLVTSSGREVPVNISLVELTVEEGAPRAICGIVTDLSQNRQRGRELAAANERLGREIGERRRAEDSLQLALDAAEMGSWNLDLRTNLSQRSRRHNQIFGIDEGVAHWGIREALTHVFPEDRARVTAAFRRAIEHGVIDLEARIARRPDGAIRWVAVKGQTFYAEGKPIRVAGVVSDITERRDVDEQLRQAQKMEAVGQLTGGIAHDFNNLLMVIGGSLDVMARVVPIQGTTRKLLDAAQRSVERGAKLNQQLLSFSRRQQLAAEDVCVNQLIPAFEQLMDRALGETIKVELDLAADLWSCHIDPHQLEMAILNLAINSRDAMPAGGTLKVRTHNRRVDHPSAIRWGATTGEYVTVSVIDTGSGMSPDIAKRVFEPFFTTKPVGKGTGLGLSQVYGFVKQSGGFVSLDSVEGVGTTVAIHLPRKAATTAAVTPVSNDAVAISRGKILLVDDDADVRLATRQMLTELGYRVVEAGDGPSALQQLAVEFGVDLMFTDLILPAGMTGMDLAREVRSRWPSLPILMTSGYSAPELLSDVAREGFRLLHKPYFLPELSQSILVAMTSGNDTQSQPRRYAR